MREEKNFLTPEDIDKQIEYIASLPYSSSDEARLIHDLKQVLPHYQNEHKDARSLQMVWQQVANAQGAYQPSQNGKKRVLQMQKVRQPERNTKEIVKPAASSRTSVIAAVVILVLLVGSMAYVLNLTKNGGKGSTLTGASHGATVYTHPGQDGSVQSIVWSADGQKTFVYDGQSIQIWDATTGANSVSYTPPAQTQDARWSPDGKFIAEASDGIYLVNAQTKNVDKKLQYKADQQPTAWQGTGQNLAKSQQNVAAYTAPMKMLAAKVPAAHGGALFDKVVWSPDSKFVVGHYTDVANNQNTLQVWNILTGKLQATYTGYSGDVQALAWSPDGKYIASAGSDKKVSVWDAYSGANVYTQLVHTESNWAGGDFSYASGVSSLAWSPDSQRLVSADHTGVVAIWDATTGKDLVKTQIADTKSSPDYKGVAALAWSPDGKSIAVGGYGVHIIDAGTVKTLSTYTEHPMYVRALAWSPDGSYIASGEGGSSSSDNVTGLKNYGTVKVWHAR